MSKKKKDLKTCKVFLGHPVNTLKQFCMWSCFTASASFEMCLGFKVVLTKTKCIDEKCKMSRNKKLRFS